LQNNELTQEFLQRIYENAKKIFTMEYGAIADFSHIVIEKDCGKFIFTLKDASDDCETYVTEPNELLKDEEINENFESFKLELTKRQQIADNFIKKNKRKLYEKLKKEFENESK
jgi:hypothetical protein